MSHCRTERGENERPVSKIQPLKKVSERCELLEGSQKKQEKEKSGRIMRGDKFYSKGRKIN